MLSEKLVNKRIKFSRILKDKGISNPRIAWMLKTSPTLISIYLQGYHSQKHYNAELDNLKKEYIRKISSSNGFISFGYEPISTQKSKRGIKIKFKPDESTENIEEDSQEFLEDLLKKCGLTLEQKITFNFEGDYLLATHHNIYERAFLEASLESVFVKNAEKE